MLGDLRLPARFWANVTVAPSGCWLWTGYTDPHGYGRINMVRNGLRRPFLAHRVAFEDLVGPIEDETLDHLCRVRNCVNPEHVEPISLVGNILRGESEPARNRRKTACKAGHKLTGDNVYWRKDRPGHRHCKTCSRESNARRRAAKRPILAMFLLSPMAAAHARPDRDEAVDRVTEVYAAIDMATEDLELAGELRAVCHRESWCNAFSIVGQHGVDAHVWLGRKRWDGAVSKGILRPDECPEHALGDDPSRWSTWGVFGQTATAVGQLEGCLGPEAMSDPLVAAQAAVATSERLCTQLDLCTCEDRVAWWSGIGRWPHRSPWSRMHKATRICGPRGSVEWLAAGASTILFAWRWR